MAIDVQATMASLLDLPPQDRLKIGETLIESVGFFVDDEVAASWNATVERRVAELKSGAVCCVPADEVFAKVDELLAARGRPVP